MVFFKRFKLPFVNIPRLLEFSFFYRKQIVTLFLLSLFSSAFFLIGPYLSKLFMDEAFIGRNLKKFLNLSCFGVIIFIFSTAIRVFGDIVRNRIAIKLRLSLTSKFIRKFYSLDMSFFQSKSVGENIYRLSGIEGIAGFILEQCPSLLVDIVKLPIILGVSLWLNIHMTIFLIVLSPLFLLRSVYLQKKLRPIYEQMWETSALISKKVHEAFSRILLVKAFGLESYQRHVYIKYLIENIRLRLKSFRWGLVNSVTSSFLSKAIYGAIALYGGWLIIKGRLTIGSYTAVILYLTQLGGLLESFTHKFEYFMQQAVSFEKFFEIMELEPKIKDTPGAKSLTSIKGEIKFNNVYFGYQPDKPIFKGINFAIPPFSWVAIAGSSGCGKTTLANLILRLYDPQEGRIFLDGLDLKDIKLKSLRENIAIVTQQPLLFDLSIKENIGYGIRGISQERVEQAARIAAVSDFINQLPQGYDTLIGEDACCLSGGLKQRIALARAVSRNPDLLVLDEATSSVDSLTEEKIFKALRQKRQGLSTIIISHRLFSVREADRIYFLTKEGTIEEGKHSQLLKASQSYKDFFNNQMETKNEDKISLST